MSTVQNRRRFPRYVLQPMYAPISVRAQDDPGAPPYEPLDGHAYDISQGGVRFEIDQRLPIGTHIAIHITMPTSGGSDLGPGHTIMAFATVAWIEEDDEHPPFRCAATFTGFARFGDRERLMRAFATGQYRMVG